MLVELAQLWKLGHGGMPLGLSTLGPDFGYISMAYSAYLHYLLKELTISCTKCLTARTSRDLSSKVLQVLSLTFCNVVFCGGR